MTPATASPFWKNGQIIPNAGTVLRLDHEDDNEEEKRRIAAEQQARQEIDAGLRAQLDAVMGEAPGVDAGVALPDQVGHRLAQTGGRARIALERALATGSDLGVNLAVRQLSQAGFSFNYRMVNVGAQQWARDYSYDLIRDINATSARLVQEKLSAWYAEGTPQSALYEALRSTFGDDRANKIAVTEITRSAAEGSLRSYRQSGVVEGVQFLTANDERVCAICAPLGGLEYVDDEAAPASVTRQRRSAVIGALDGRFVHPGGIGKAARYAGKIFVLPAHVLCRCKLAPVVKVM